MARKRGNFGGIPLVVLVLGIAGAVAFLVHSQYLKRAAEIGADAGGFEFFEALAQGGVVGGVVGVADRRPAIPYRPGPR